MNVGTSMAVTHQPGSFASETRKTGSWILLSLLVHILGFYLFQVINDPVVLFVPPVRPLTLEMGNARGMELPGGDPALFSRPPFAEDQAVLKWLEYPDWKTGAEMGMRENPEAAPE